jgi:hypothetical protein
LRCGDQGGYVRMGLYLRRLDKKTHRKFSKVTIWKATPWNAKKEKAE